MVKTIETIFKELNTKYKLKQFYLASGGPADVKGLGTSDVDIVYLVDKTTDYMNLDHIFPGYKKDQRPDKMRCYYLTKYAGRDVSICASSDISVMRSIKHRKAELMLLIYPLITTCVIFHKLNGVKTEPAWALVLGLQGDPYDEMTMDLAKLKKIAQKKEKELKQIKDRIC